MSFKPVVVGSTWRHRDTGDHVIARIDETSYSSPVAFGSRPIAACAGEPQPMFLDRDSRTPHEKSDWTWVEDPSQWCESCGKPQGYNPRCVECGTLRASKVFHVYEARATWACSVCQGAATFPGLPCAPCQHRADEEQKAQRKKERLARDASVLPLVDGAQSPGFDALMRELYSPAKFDSLETTEFSRLVSKLAAEQLAEQWKSVEAAARDSTPAASRPLPPVGADVVMVGSQFTGRRATVIRHAACLPGLINVRFHGYPEGSAYGCDASEVALVAPTTPAAPKPIPQWPTPATDPPPLTARERRETAIRELIAACPPDLEPKGWTAAALALAEGPGTIADFYPGHARDGLAAIVRNPNVLNSSAKWRADIYRAYRRALEAPRPPEGPWLGRRSARR